MKATFYTLLVLFVFQFNPIGAQQLEIQYLANEGVLIKTLDTQILIDAIFLNEFDYLDVLPQVELNKIKNAEGKFQNIDLIMTTHFHGDHFNAQLSGAHLAANKKTIFLGPEETVINFKESFIDFQNIASQVRSETPRLFESKIITLNDMEIKVIRLNHFGTLPWKDAENVAYLITIEGKKILHLGDSEISSHNLDQLGLKNENIDVAILPYWQLNSTKQRDIIEKYIQPKQILVAHIPLKNYPTVQEEISNLDYNNATVLVNQFMSIMIE